MVTTIETQQFARGQADRLLRNLAFQVNRAIKTSSANSIHDVRVAIRRFSQIIALCKPCFPGKDMRKIRRRLKKMMDIAGEVRNCDVALKLIAKAQLSDAVQLKSELEKRRKESSRILANELKNWADRQMSLKWRSVLEAALARNDGALGITPIHEASQRTLGRMVKAFQKHGSQAASVKASPDELHQFRIEAKKFRYTVELFEPLYGASLHPGLAKIKCVQAILGDINDCLTVADLVAHYEGSGGLVARLKKRQRKKTEEFRRYWSEKWLEEEPLRGWMDRLARPPAQARKPAASSGHVSPPPLRKRAAVA